MDASCLFHMQWQALAVHMSAQCCAWRVRRSCLFTAPWASRCASSCGGSLRTWRRPRIPALGRLLPARRAVMRLLPAQQALCVARPWEVSVCSLLGHLWSCLARAARVAGQLALLETDRLPNRVYALLKHVGEQSSARVQVSSNFLDRIRTLKARMVRLKTKVETVRPLICANMSAHCARR